MAKQSKNDEVSDVKSMDKMVSQRKWTVITTAKIAMVPFVLIVAACVYLIMMQSQLLGQGEGGADVPLSDVELVAGLVGALTEHHTMTIDNLGKSSAGNAWMALQKRSKKDAALKYSERLAQLDLSTKEGSKWSKAVQLSNKYVSSNVDTSDQVALDLDEASAGKMTKEFVKVHASLIGLLKAPGMDSSEAASDSESTSESGSLGSSSQFMIVTLGLLALIALSVIVMSFLHVRSAYKRLGGTPEELQMVANTLSSGEKSGSTNNLGTDYFGLMESLHEIGVKLEEHRAGKRLAKQINGRLGHSEHNITSKELEEDAANEPLSNDQDSLEHTDSTQSSKVQNIISPSAVSHAVQPPSESHQDTLNELKDLHALNEENELRISALLAMSKYISDGDLTKRSGVTGEDQIGQIAHYQDLNVEALKNRLTIFGDQSGSLKVSSQSLIEINDHMIHSSVQTAEQAELVSSSAEEISQNVDSVALAVKEMSASIREISEHTAEAAQVAEHAVVLASDTDATVRKLSESSTAIDAVIKVINSIAEQTNLLALNATIEAARAGDAGKGFAVVANEVKELAKETARATEEIAQQIATIQSDSHDAVTVIGDISKIIDRVNEIQSTIAAAVEEQSVTTAEINRSINDVSHGSSQIAKNVSDVAETAKENKDSVETAKETVETIINVSNDLDEMLAGYKLTKTKKRRKAA